MREETISGTTYRIGKLTAKQQWNVIRRLGAVLATAGPAFASLEKATATTPDGDGNSLAVSVDLDTMFSAFGPLASALGDLSDEASDYVIGVCLSVCYMNRGATWAAVATPRGEIMFSDITLPVMLQLTMLSIQESMADFFAAIPGSSNVQR